MSSKPPTGYVEIRAFAHATEDSEKVLTAVRNLLPEDLAQTVLFKKNNVLGHHGNPIVLFTSTLADKKTLPALLEKIGSSISALDKERFNQNLKLHLEKSNLYLRFDKQAACLGTFKFSQIDPIHFKVHFKNKTYDEIVDICKKTGLLL